MFNRPIEEDYWYQESLKQLQNLKESVIEMEKEIDNKQKLHKKIYEAFQTLRKHAIDDYFSEEDAGQTWQEQIQSLQHPPEYWTRRAASKLNDVDGYCEEVEGVNDKPNSPYEVFVFRSEEQKVIKVTVKIGCRFYETTNCDRELREIVRSLLVFMGEV